MKLVLLDFCLVAIGGLVGAIARYGVNLGLDRWTDKLPVGTIAVNLTGCLAIGFLYGGGWLTSHDKLRLLLAVGFLGSFTTFSTFALDAIRSAESGNGWWAVVNVCLSLVGGLLATVVGMAIGKTLS